MPGAADRSYGIQVARLAGLPDAVTARASEVLKLLETSEARPNAESLLDDLPLFAAARPKSVVGVEASQTAGTSLLHEALDTINPDELSPKEALEALYRLKGIQRETDAS